MSEPTNNFTSSLNNVAQLSFSSVNNFLLTLNETLENAKDLEKLILKNRNSQRMLKTKILAKKKKMVSLTSELKSLELELAQKQTEHDTLNLKLTTAKDV